MSIMDRLDGVISRHSELSALMASGDLDPSKYADLSREYAELSPIVEKAQEMKSTQSELLDLEDLLSDGDTDAEMKELAELEREELKGRLPDLEEALRILLLPKDAADEKSAILEIRAGTGGDEAALFAGDLMRMYQRYAEVHGWRAEFLDLSETELGGVEAAISIAGRRLRKLKFESGVHRVQRYRRRRAAGGFTPQPPPSRPCRRQEVDIEVDPGDRVDTYRQRRRSHVAKRKCHTDHPYADGNRRAVSGREIAA